MLYRFATKVLGSAHEPDIYIRTQPSPTRCVSQKISCEGVGRRPISFGQTNWHTQMWLKQWMQYELFLENLVLVDLKRVGPP